MIGTATFLILTVPAFMLQDQQHWIWLFKLQIFQNLMQGPLPTEIGSLLHELLFRKLAAGKLWHKKARLQLMQERG